MWLYLQRVQNSACYLTLEFKKNTAALIGRCFYFNNLVGHNFCLYLYKIIMRICIEPDSQNNNELLNQILQNQIKIMALIDDLKEQIAGLQTQAADLQTSLDAEQEQITALLATNAGVVTDLNNQIATLTAQLAGSANPTQLQEVIDGIIAIRDSLATTKTDLEGTV